MCIHKNPLKLNNLLILALVHLGHNGLSGLVGANLPIMQLLLHYIDYL